MPGVAGRVLDERLVNEFCNLFSIQMRKFVLVPLAFFFNLSSFFATLNMAYNNYF